MTDAVNAYRICLNRIELEMNLFVDFNGNAKNFNCTMHDRLTNDQYQRSTPITIRSRECD